MAWHALQLSSPNPNEFFRLTKGLMEFGAYDEVRPFSLSCMAPPFGIYISFSEMSNEMALTPACPPAALCQVEMVMFEAHELINRYMMENPERVLLATWGESAFPYVECKSLELVGSLSHVLAAFDWIETGREGIVCVCCRVGHKLVPMSVLSHKLLRSPAPSAGPSPLTSSYVPGFRRGAGAEEGQHGLPAHHAAGAVHHRQPPALSRHQGAASFYPPSLWTALERTSV